MMTLGREGKWVEEQKDVKRQNTEEGKDDEHKMGQEIA